MAYNLTMDEQDMANSQVARLRDYAHQRFMEGRSNFVGSNPNAVSPGERAAFAPPSVQTLALRQHEMDMLKQQGENAIGVEKEHSAGLRGQGAEAAGLRGEAERDVARITGETQRALEEIKGNNALSVEEQRMIGAENVENIKGETARDVAETQGKYGVLQQQEIANGNMARSELKRQQKEKEIAAQIQKAHIAAGAKIGAATSAAHSKIISEALENGLSGQQSVQEVMEQLKQAYKDNPEMLTSISAFTDGGTPAANAGGATGGAAAAQPKEGDTKDFSDGKGGKVKAVFKNGKWVQVQETK